MKRTIVAAALALTGLALAGCSSSDDEASTIPTVTTVNGEDASVVAQVDCGDDGVANVTATYGSTKKETLVGRNSTTQSAGGVDTFSNQYGTMPGNGDATLTVLTQPTRGTCMTTLTDYNTGDVIAERETAGKVELSVVVRADA